MNKSATFFLSGLLIAAPPASASIHPGPVRMKAVFPSVRRAGGALGASFYARPGAFALKSVPALSLSLPSGIVPALQEVLARQEKASRALRPINDKAASDSAASASARDSFSALTGIEEVKSKGAVTAMALVPSGPGPSGEKIQEADPGVLAEKGQWDVPAILKTGTLLPRFERKTVGFINAWGFPGLMGFMTGLTYIVGGGHWNWIAGSLGAAWGLFTFFSFWLDAPNMKAPPLADCFRMLALYAPARLGNARSQFKLGSLYFKYFHDEKAGKWLLKAAAGGLPEARLSLYAHSRELRVEKAQALKQLAQALKHPPAQSAP